MSATFSIPADVASHLARISEVLLTHKAQIDRDWDIWADEDPDPENGDFWMLKIDSPDADKLRNNLQKIAEFLAWLAKFSDDAEGRA